MKEKHTNGCNILMMTFTNLTQIDLKVSLEEDTIIPFPKGS